MSQAETNHPILEDGLAQQLSDEPVAISASTLMRLRKFNLPIVEELLAQTADDAEQNQREASEVVFLDEFRQQQPLSVEVSSSEPDADTTDIEPRSFNSLTDFNPAQLVLIEKLYPLVGAYTKRTAAQKLLSKEEFGSVLDSGYLGLIRAVRDFDFSNEPMVAEAVALITSVIKTEVLAKIEILESQKQTDGKTTKLVEVQVDPDAINAVFRSYQDLTVDKITSRWVDEQSDGLVFNIYRIAREFDPIEQEVLLRHFALGESERTIAKELELTELGVKVLLNQIFNEIVPKLVG